MSRCSRYSAWWRQTGVLALGIASVLASATVYPHDLITAEAAERYLAQAGEQQRIFGSKASAAQRAQAHVALGIVLDEIRDLLNRDIASHGKVQGLPSEYLVAELKARGTPLATEPGIARYPANLEHYREALRLAPEADGAAQAGFRLLQGYFYDSFTDDPLTPRGQTWPQLSAQIDVGQRCLRRGLGQPQREEAEFILAVHYVQAARKAPERAARANYARRAQDALAAFESRYPDSLRMSAVGVLRDQIPK